MTEISRHIESQEKFHHLFVGISGAVLAAAIQTVKFENLGRYGILFEISGWVFLATSLLIALFNTWKIQQLFYGSLQAEKAGERLNSATEPGTAIALGNQFRSFVDQFEKLGNIFNQRIKWQFVFFVAGILSIGFSRSIVGIMKFKAIH
jgi:hypothetical protein